MVSDGTLARRIGTKAGGQIETVGIVEVNHMDKIKVI
jgi:hypothetical protein